MYEILLQQCKTKCDYIVQMAEKKSLSFKYTESIIQPDGSKKKWMIIMERCFWSLYAGHVPLKLRKIYQIVPS